MIINAAALEEVFLGLKTTFMRSVDAAETSAIAVLMVDVPSTKSGERYPVGVLLATLQKVVDEVTVGNIGVWMQQVNNDPYAVIVEIKRDEIADDEFGIHRQTVAQLGDEAAMYPMVLAAEQLLAGFTTEWIDGNPVFYADERSWPNSDVGFTNRSDVALTADNFDTAYQALESRTNPVGRTLNLTPNLLVCGPSNRSAGETIVETQYASGGGNNRLYKRCKLLVLHGITDDSWFLMAAGGSKPMVLQNREGPEFTAQDQPSDDNAFYRERYGYKARRRCAVAILAPWLIQASAGA